MNSTDSEEFGGQSRVADRENFGRQLAKTVNSSRSVDEELGDSDVFGGQRKQMAK